jgi:hypothetical protein
MTVYLHALISHSSATTHFFFCALPTPPDLDNVALLTDQVGMQQFGVNTQYITLPWVRSELTQLMDLPCNKLTSLLCQCLTNPASIPSTGH